MAKSVRVDNPIIIVLITLIAAGAGGYFLVWYFGVVLALVGAYFIYTGFIKGGGAAPQQPGQQVPGQPPVQQPPQQPGVPPQQPPQQRPPGY